MLYNVFSSAAEKDSVSAKRISPYSSITYEHSPEPENKTRQEERHINEPVAIVGISGRFPQTDTLDDFWEGIEKGRDMITDIPEDRWDWKESFDKSAFFYFCSIDVPDRIAVKLFPVPTVFRNVCNHIPPFFNSFPKVIQRICLGAKNFYGDCMENNRRCGL